MEKIEFISFSDLNRWKDAVQLTGDHEGWVLAEEDFERWSDGFGKDNFNLLCAVEKESGKTVGTVATAVYKSIDGSEPLVTVGMFFISPEFRSCGLGLELFNRVLKDLKFENKSINWGLNGVKKMTKKYATKFGFDKYPNWQIAAFEASIRDIEPERLESDPSMKTVSLRDIDFKKFIEFDTVMTGGIRRDGFIQKFLDSKNAFSKIALKEEKIVGVCNIRIGYKNQLVIGPFYAETAAIAEGLLKDILKMIPNLSQYSKIFIFPASTNQEAKEIFFKLAENKVQEYDSMFGQFTKHVIETDASKIYSITEYAMSYC